jgi:hypothetical protein
MAALEQAYETGAKSRYEYASDGILKRWHNDPQFIEFLLQAEKEANRQRGLLNAEVS